MSLFLDLMTDAPLAPSARGMLACVLVVERVADPVRVVQEWADDELSDRSGDLLGKARKLTLSTRTYIEAPVAASFRHAAPVLRNR